MDRRVLGLGCAAALLLGVPSAQAQGTVKIGLINVLSGQFADAGIQLDHGVARYMADAEAVYSFEGTHDMNNLIVGRAITGIAAFV